MARKVSKQIIIAFLNGTAKCVGNTFTDGNAIYLHGNKIIWKEGEAYPVQYNITLAGWPTVTTRERINAFLTAIGAKAGVFQSNHYQFFTSIDGNTRAIESEEIISIY